MKEVNIKHRKDGRFEARIVIDGKRKSIYGKSVSEVRKNVKQLQQEISKGNIISKNIRLNAAMETYLVDIKKCKVKDTTYDRVESTFKYHIKDEALGRMQLGAITAQDIQKLLSDQCEKGLSTSSIKKIYNLLGEFFRYATAIREIGWNPMSLVEMPHASKIQYKSKEMEVLNASEMKQVVAIAEQINEDGQPCYRYGEAIVLLLLTGLRSGEIRGIHINDIDLKQRILHIHTNIVYAKDRENGGIKYIIGDVKTKKSIREIPLNDRAILAIQRLLNTTYNPENGFLLCTSNGKIVTHSHLQRCYSAILTKAGIQHMGMHSTRHSFATAVLKDAEDKGQIKEVSELLGHSDVSVTYEHYIKASNEDKRNLVNQLNKLVG